MTRRSDQVRSQNRKVLFWSVVVVVLAHAAFFTLTPEFEAEPMEGSEVVQGEAGLTAAPPPIPVLASAVFGAPRIVAADGSVHLEPPERELQATRLLDQPMPCGDISERAPERFAGEVRLRIGPAGGVTIAQVEESTGSSCGDDVMVGMARSIVYHWLPSERFPAPVEVIQPVTLEVTRG